MKKEDIQKRLKKIGIKDLGDNSLGSSRGFEVPQKFSSLDCVLYLTALDIPGVKFLVLEDTSDGTTLNFHLKKGVLYESICLDIVEALESFDKLDPQEFAKCI